MKISGEHEGEFSIFLGEREALRHFFHYAIHQIKTGSAARADRIPAGPSGQLTLVPGRTMQEGCQRRRRAGDPPLRRAAC